MSTIHTVHTDEMVVGVDLDCGYCGFAGTVAVRSRGTGESTSLVIFDRDHARGAAAEQALEDVMHQARVTAALLPCPRCRRRSRAAVVQFVVATALGVVALCGVAAVAWWIQVGLWRWLTTLLVVSGAVMLVRNKQKRLAGSESLVESVTPRVQLPPATALKVGAPRRPTPIAASAPAPAPVDVDPSAPPKLLG